MEIQMYLQTVGADPEFFFKRRGRMLPSCGLLGGTKEQPKDLPGYPLFQIQEDNVMGEMNVPPARDFDTWRGLYRPLHQHIDALAGGLNAEAVILPSARFTDNALRSKQAKMFGCSPDQNAWTMQGNATISPEKLKRQGFGNHRFAGGHVHLGINYGHSKTYSKHVQNILVVRMCDVYLGLPAVILDPDYERRNFYGRAGNYRTKDYGVEYRTLSNFWLTKPEYWEWVYRAAARAVHRATAFKAHVLNKGVTRYDIIGTINNSNVRKARELVKLLDIPMPEGYEYHAD
jgi:hypothetical protein